MVDKANQIRFSKEIFLVANVSPKVVFEMSFLTRSDAHINVSDREFWWKIYNIEKALLNTRHVKLVGTKEFAAAVLDPEYETYVVHVASLGSTSSNVHSFWRPHISGLIAKEAFIKLFDEYANIANVFSPELVSELSKHNEINDHIIKLVDGQQLPYELVYSLRPVELETLKVYIGTDLATSFIRLYKSLAGAFILFDRTSDSYL